MDCLPDFAPLLEGLGRPADLVVLTEAEWRARQGTALRREVVTRGIRLPPPT